MGVSVMIVPTGSLGGKNAVQDDQPIRFLIINPGCYVKRSAHKLLLLVGEVKFPTFCKQAGAIECLGVFGQFSILQRLCAT